MLLSLIQEQWRTHVYYICPLPHQTSIYDISMNLFCWPPSADIFNILPGFLWQPLLSLFVLARGTLKFLFHLKLDSQLLRGGRSSCSLWSELQVMEAKSLVVIDCLCRESVSKLAWGNASLYGTNGKIIRMARFCSCSSSADKYAGSALWNTGSCFKMFL